MDLPKKGIYRHYKGKRYELIDFARHSETMEMMVVYRALYGSGELWVRPLSMWSETVQKDGKSFLRFAPEEAVPNTLLPQDQGINSMEAWPENDNSLKRMPDFEAMPKASPEAPDLLLKRVFGYDAFREGQKEIIASILEGRDTLAILPTGGGKSICYQLSALKLEGVALVVSPLISLMKDQVESLLQTGIPAAYLNSSLSERQMNAALRNMVRGKYRIVYVAPERLLTPRFLDAISRVHISMLAVDEAHCISQWGHDFRPSYLEIPRFIEKLKHPPRICAFTATATQRVQKDILQMLEMHDPFVRITSFNRPNLYFSVCHTREKQSKLLELLESYRGFSGIVYCGTRKLVETVCEIIGQNGYAVTRYHAGLSEEERQKNQDDFIYERAQIMVATNAFGMGIDKSNVRFVIHYNMPKDLESYYQEAGRAGRDGERADCHLLFEPKDIVLQKYFIDKMGEELELEPAALQKVQDSARERMRAMADYCNTSRCLRSVLLHYFGQTGEKNCGYCSNCLNPQAHADVTQAGQLVVAMVMEQGERYGIRLILDALLGKESERVLATKLDQSAYFGALKNLSANNARRVVDALLDAGILYQTDTQYPILKCTNRAADFMKGQRPLWAYQDGPAKVKKTRKERPAKKLPENVDLELLERLRQLRMQLSRIRSVPPDVICTDATLVDLCRQQPLTLEDMRFVRGMGEQKIKSVGDAFVRAIVQYVQDREE